MTQQDRSSDPQQYKNEPGNQTPNTPGVRESRGEDDRSESERRSHNPSEYKNESGNQT